MVNIRGIYKQFWLENYDSLSPLFGTEHSFFTWVGKRHKSGTLYADDVVKDRAKQLGREL